MSFLRAIVSFPDSPQTGRAPHGSPVLVHATAVQTAGAIGMWESFVEPGKGPTPHTHTRETEVFRVISGTFRFWCGADTFEGGVGTVVTLPPHVPHHWINIGHTTGRMMGIATPGGAEQLFLQIAQLEHPTPDDIMRIEQSLGITSH